MIGNMLLMCELGGIFCTQYERLVMAFNTLSFRNMAVPLNNTEMAFLTGHPSLNIFSMIEVPTINFNISLWCEMARGATPYSTRKTLPLPFGTSLVVMADETVCLMNGKVHSLNELGVTGGASKLHFPSQFTQMFFVREGYILVDHILLEILNLMASLLEATCIADLCVRRARPFPGNKIGQ
jgi:hypothetical protein